MIFVNSLRLWGAATGLVMATLPLPGEAAPPTTSTDRAAPAAVAPPTGDSPAQVRAPEGPPAAANTSWEMSEFEGGVGWWFLPTGSVCTSVECQRGDSSLLLHVGALVHLGPAWAVGAGGDFALTPTSGVEPLDAGSPTERRLGRSLLFLEGEFRWFPWRQTQKPSGFQLWGGASGGLALLSDRYHSPLENETGPLRIGSRGTVLRTPGWSLRPGLGLDWQSSRWWALGGSLRPGLLWWPTQRQTTPFGDQATIAGLHWSLSVAFTLKVRSSR